MILDNYADAVRQNIIRAMGKRAQVHATIMRAVSSPFSRTEPATIGSVTGYRYIKRGSDNAIRLGIPGELADQFDSEWLMDFGRPLSTAQAGDMLEFEDGDTRRIASARDGVAGVYRLYRLEVVTA